MQSDGLSDAEAARRLSADGPNKRKHSFLYTELSIAGNAAIGHSTAAIISDRRWARTVSNGMEAPTRNGIRCAKVEVRTTT